MIWLWYLIWFGSQLTSVDSSAQVSAFLSTSSSVGDSVTTFFLFNPKQISVLEIKSYKHFIFKQNT